MNKPPIRKNSIVQSTVRRIHPAADHLSMDDTSEFIMNMPDEVLSRIQFSMPWQHDPDTGEYPDPDGFDVRYTKTRKEDYKVTRDVLQIECWDKFHKNPQVNTSVRGMTGRLTGLDFGIFCDIWEIQEAIEEIELDPRNRLYNYMPKYVGRTLVEGELFVIFTLHPDGFVEIDFLDPARLSDKGDDNSGIIFHPDKPSMPLIYSVGDATGNEISQIPSIFIARYPDLLDEAAKHKDFKEKMQGKNRSRKAIYKKFHRFNRFVVAWDRGYITKRAVSYLRTTLEWLNHYENLKKYEIDHKKSAGAYVWKFKIENPRDFKVWLALSDVDKRKTGIMAKKTPGSSIVLPPGMDLSVENPRLPPIRDEDTDILGMVASGLNEPEDIMTGKAGGTFASVKETRGPMSDRVSDEVAYFSRFLRHDFWGSIFFLKSAIGKFPETFKIKKAIGWKKGKKDPETDEAPNEPVFKNIRRRPELLLEINFPTSEVIQLEERARGLLGVKHGPVSETLGIPMEDVSKKLGMGNYKTLRLKKAEEDDTYPELVYTVDAEALQEAQEAERGKQQANTAQPAKAKKKTPTKEAK